MPRRTSLQELTAQARAMREIEARPDCPKTIGAYWQAVAAKVGITPEMASTRARANEIGRAHV